MSNPPFGNPPPGPPPRSSGMSTVTIVLIVLGVLALICCGACGSCMYFGSKAGGGFAVMGTVLPRIQNDPQVIDKFGSPVQPAGMPTASSANLQQGETSTVDFEITGPKGKGKVHAETKTGVNGFEPTVIRVTAPDGSTINVPTGNDPTDVQISTPDLDMPEGSSDE